MYDDGILRAARGIDVPDYSSLGSVPLSFGTSAPRPTLGFSGIPEVQSYGVSKPLSYGSRFSGSTVGLFDNVTSFLNFGQPVSGAGVGGPGVYDDGPLRSVRTSGNFAGQVTTGSIQGGAGFADALKATLGNVLGAIGAKSDEPRVTPVSYTTPGQSGSSMLPILLLGGLALAAGGYLVTR